MAQYFTFNEFLKSSTADKLEIDNLPDNDVVTDNIITLMGIMDKFREKWTVYCKENELGNPAIIITSGFRCKELNEAIGGAKKSAHRIGAACDFEAQNGHNKELFEVCKDFLQNEWKKGWEELINEKNYSWIHFAFVDINYNRKCEIFE